MGNMGGIERLMVFGILMVIITILGIAFFSASDMDEPPEDFVSGKGAGNAADSFYREDLPPSPAATAAVSNGSSAGIGGNAGGAESLPADLGATPLKVNATIEGSVPGTGERRTAAGTVTPASSAPETTPAPAAPRTYTIRKGDSFAKIARKILGDEKWTKAIIKENPGIDPFRLQVGEVIRLPDIESLGAAGAAKKPGKERNEEGGKTYIVKENDSLCKIAEKVLGDKRLWKKIYDANRDILLDPDSLIPGMELRIP